MAGVHRQPRLGFRLLTYHCSANDISAVQDEHASCHFCQPLVSLPNIYTWTAALISFIHSCSCTLITDRLLPFHNLGQSPAFGASRSVPLACVDRWLYAPPLGLKAPVHSVATHIATCRRRRGQPPTHTPQRRPCLQLATEEAYLHICAPRVHYINRTGLSDDLRGDAAGRKALAIRGGGTLAARTVGTVGSRSSGTIAFSL